MRNYKPACRVPLPEALRAKYEVEEKMEIDELNGKKVVIYTFDEYVSKFM